MNLSRKHAMLASMLVAGLMLAGKWIAYTLTGSAALLADAAESVVHGAATGFAAFSLWYSARPPDPDHPYGHGRIAYLSVAFEGVLVLAASVAVISSGAIGLLRGVHIENLEVGLFIASGLAAVNLLLGVLLLRAGKRHNAIILTANGRHVLADVWTTAAALLGLALVRLTGHTWLDPLVALLIGFGIGVSALRLLTKAVAGMMDHLDPAVLQRIREVLEGAVGQNHIDGFHQLRCRIVDDALWIDVHVQVAGELKLKDAHDRATMVEAALQRAFPDQIVNVTSHLEPDDHDEAHPIGHEALRDPLTTSA